MSPRSAKSAHYDAIVVGGGIVGVSTAYVLARRGLSVLLLERYAPVHEHGSSHGDSRMIRFDYEENGYVEMAARAFRAWEDLAKRLGRPVFKRTGICNLAPAGAAVLETLETRLRECGLPFERLARANFAHRFPQLSLPPHSEAIYQPDSAVLFADEVVRNLWDCVVEDGVDALTETEVASIVPAEERVEVTAADGRSWSGTFLVLATGSWTDRWLNALGIDVDLVVTRELLAYFPQAGPVPHEAGAMPNVIDYHTSDPFYCVPQVRVPGVKAGCHRTGRVVKADDPVEVDDANLEAVRAFIGRRCPHLSRDPVAVKHCLYTNSADFHFILDRHPDYANVVLAAGFSGHGFKFGPVLGEILAARLFDETPPVDTNLFGLERFSSQRVLKPRTLA
ncbi:MAG: N-methyl-L-tryptophan oxidase [Gemmatimonadetes bacterium]|nr:N-methyl-L-tryptophan oxidase [Gemmatimonadota bacterium]